MNFYKKNTYENICGNFALLIRNYPNSENNVIISQKTANHKTVFGIVYSALKWNNKCYAPTLHVPNNFVTITMLL